MENLAPPKSDRQIVILPPNSLVNAFNIADRGPLLLSNEKSGGNPSAVISDRNDPPTFAGDLSISSAKVCITRNSAPRLGARAGRDKSASD
jgi:hypothetical protein